ncbi:MAG: hypothetical protein JRI67_12630, partial [Deltaproteobacteria bacterium]|nr:hypothetical protein [Deltaproteobacteria bacterium]
MAGINTPPTDNISIFANAVSTTPVSNTTWQKTLEDIRSDKYQKRIENVRVKYRKFGWESDEYRKVKKALPAGTFSGTFRAPRNKVNVLSTTGYIVVDLDHSDEKTESIFVLLKQDKNVWFIFRSPSGEGIKVGIRGQNIENDDDHKKLYFAVEKYFLELYGLKIDPSCKDISRLTFVSHDPKSWINPDPQYFDISAWEKPLPLPPQPVKPPVFADSSGTEKYARKALESRCREIRESPPGNQHYTRLRASILIGGFL